MFDDFVRGNCSPFAPVDSSDRMKTAIYNFFHKKHKLKKYTPQVQRIVLGKENVQTFMHFIQLAKERYVKDVVEPLNEKREVKKTPKWEVPTIISFNKKVERQEHSKSIMQPFFIKRTSKPERDFMKALDKSKKVKWWFKNGENEVKYFAVTYEDENGFKWGFYVDFIVMFKDGSVGLFDTKSGIHAKNAGPRAKGLAKYIKKHKKKKKVWGGIVIPIKVKNNVIWRYNDKKMYNYDPNDLSDWKVLEL